MKIKNTTGTLILNGVKIDESVKNVLIDLILRMEEIKGSTINGGEIVDLIIKSGKEEFSDEDLIDIVKQYDEIESNILQVYMNSENLVKTQDFRAITSIGHIIHDQETYEIMRLLEDKLNEHINENGLEISPEDMKKLYVIMYDEAKKARDYMDDIIDFAAVLKPGFDTLTNIVKNLNKK